MKEERGRKMGFVRCEAEVAVCIDGRELWKAVKPDHIGAPKCNSGDAA
jgi:hypothetical protein